MNRLLTKIPVGRQLLQLLYLPIAELQQHAVWHISESTALPKGAQSVLAEQLLDGVLHEYFVDAEGRRLHAILEKFDVEPAVKELRGMLHRLVLTTTGPLVPSYVYRYLIEGDTLHLTPTLPTIDDYEQRIEALADPDEGWVSARHRR